MVDAAINVAAEQIVEFSAYGALLSRDGNHGPAASPQNLYRSRDDEGDSWVAIAVETGARGRRYESCSGGPPGRWTARCSRPCPPAESDAIDEHLAAWCRIAPATRSCAGSGARESRSRKSCSLISRSTCPSSGFAASSKPSSIRSPAPRGTARCRCDSRPDPSAFTSGTRRCSVSTPRQLLTSMGMSADRDQRAGRGQRDRRTSRPLRSKVIR